MEKGRMEGGGEEEKGVRKVRGGGIERRRIGRGGREGREGREGKEGIRRVGGRKEEEGVRRGG